jgi:hypothetical protein
MTDTGPTSKSGSGREFARHRFQWLDQVCADRSITPARFQLAYVITGFVNRGTGDAWPSQKTLAAKIGLTVLGIRKLAVALSDRGHLKVTESRGRGHSARYRPILKAVASENAPPEVPIREAGPTSAATPGPTSPGGFDEWWAHYPRKVAKGAAQVVWERVIKSGKANAVDLLAGAMRYAAERDGQDAKYTKHPRTWLNAECWLDEGPPSSEVNQQTIDQTGLPVPQRTERPKQKPVESWTAIAMKGLP